MKRTERERLIAWLLEENPEWPQPADPFEGLPAPERASCDRDWTVT